MHTICGLHLELRNEGSNGYCHYLDERPVHAGSLVELLTDNRWVLGRYEWNFRPESRPYVITNAVTDEAILLDPQALLRWPR